MHLGSEFRLALADGRLWQFSPSDRPSALFLQQLADHLQLQTVRTAEGTVLRFAQNDPGARRSTAQNPPRAALRRLPRRGWQVTPGPGMAMWRHPLHASVVFGLSDPQDPHDETRRMRFALFPILETALEAGGFLIHAGLLEKDGEGVLISGHSGVGKSTACGRVGAPWIARCDEEVLVVRSADGGYAAHPLPTWSEAAAGVVPRRIEQSVRLQGIFFLEQAVRDQATPIHRPEALLATWQAAQLKTLDGWPWTQGSLSAEIKRRLFENIARFCQSLPAFALEISLEGAFWTQIEAALPLAGSQGAQDQAACRSTPGAGGEQRRLAPRTPLDQLQERADAALLTHAGLSMAPLLIPGDRLQVIPRRGLRLKRGDVIAFSDPQQDAIFVHRIIKVGRGFVQTQGDNNQAPDQPITNLRLILGLVVEGQRGGNPYRLQRGLWGRLQRRHPWLVERLEFYLLRRGRSLIRRIYHTPLMSRLLEKLFRLRLVSFRRPWGEELQLFWGGKLIGRRSAASAPWQIRRPFRALVRDHARIPVDARDPSSLGGKEGRC